MPEIAQLTTGSSAALGDPVLFGEQSIPKPEKPQEVRQISQSMLRESSLREASRL